MTREFLTDPSRSGKIGNNPQDYLERSISNLRKLSIQRLIRGNSSPEEKQKFNNSIKNREAILEYITKNPDFLESINP
jgi:hypothetical protein